MQSVEHATTVVRKVTLAGTNPEEQELDENAIWRQEEQGCHNSGSLWSSNASLCSSIKLELTDDAVCEGRFAETILKVNVTKSPISPRGRQRRIGTRLRTLEKMSRSRQDKLSTTAALRFKTPISLRIRVMRACGSRYLHRRNTIQGTVGNTVRVP